MATARGTLKTAAQVSGWTKEKTLVKEGLMQPYPPGFSIGALIVAQFATTPPAAFTQPVGGGGGNFADG